MDFFFQYQNCVYSVEIYLIGVRSQIAFGLQMCSEPRCHRSAQVGWQKSDISDLGKEKQLKEQGFD